MMSDDVIVLDLEIVKDIPEGVEWESIRPLGISCIGIIRSQFEEEYNEPLAFFHCDELEQDSLEGIPEGAMTKSDVASFVRASYNACRKQGTRFVTWNGLSFDFNILAEESGMYDECKWLARNHVDMMFQIVCTKGFRLSLNSAAKGMGLPGKMEDVGGAAAPIMWRGTVQDRFKVIEYLKQDVRTTLDVYNKVLEHKYISWTSKTGRRQMIPIPRWLTVEECMELPFPDTSWMTDPPIRENYYAWIKNNS